MLFEEGPDVVYERHEEVAARCHEHGTGLGLDIHPDVERNSPTVMAFHLPGGAKRVQAELESEHDIILATRLVDLASDILRIGHMGYNADVKEVDRVTDALEGIPPVK